MENKLVVSGSTGKIGQKQETWKIIVVGVHNTGKTSIVERYCDGKFKDCFPCTVGINLKKKTINFENKTVVLHIWDTAGAEKYESLVQSYYRFTKGILIVYDVTNLNSILKLNTWIENIDKFAPSNAVKILVGNKCDLESNREVSTEEGRLIAEHFGIPFFELSSKNNINIDDLFLKLVSMINEMELEIAIKKGNVILEDKVILEDVKTPSKRCDIC